MDLAGLAGGRAVAEGVLLHEELAGGLLRQRAARLVEDLGGGVVVFLVTARDELVHDGLRHLARLLGRRVALEVADAERHVEHAVLEQLAVVEARAAGIVGLRGRLELLVHLGGAHALPGLRVERGGQARVGLRAAVAVDRVAVEPEALELLLDRLDLRLGPGVGAGGGGTLRDVLAVDAAGDERGDRRVPDRPLEREDAVRAQRIARTLDRRVGGDGLLGGRCGGRLGRS